MTQSSKFLNLQRILTQDQSIKQVLKFSNEVVNKYSDLGITNFISYDDLQLLAHRLNLLKIPEINNVLENIKYPHAIVAFPLRITNNFTLFFVIVPPHRKFDWHSHPKMGGISKCFHGQLRISTVDGGLLLPDESGSYLYPKSKMRVQNIKQNDEQTTSIIEHDVYNIHKIEALELSAFFDLLVPDYPDNTCQFYRTVEDRGEELVLEEVEQEQEEIIGWDVYYQQLINREKHRVKTYILK